jgi:hypothetical protein
MKNTKLTSLALASLVAASSASAAVVYFENFNNSAGSNQQLSTVSGWSAFVNRGTDVGLDVTTTSTSVLVQNAAGSAQVGVDAGYTANGFVRIANAAGTVTQTLLFDNLTSNPLSQSTQTIDNVQFFMANNSVAIVTHVAVRIGGNWYGSNTGFTTNFATGSNLFDPASTDPVNTNDIALNFAFTNAASAWRDITFTPGSALSIAASTLAADLPTGDITGLGLFVVHNGGGSRALDGVVVNASPIPEPATFAALAGVGALGLAAMRRRRA